MQRASLSFMIMVAGCGVALPDAQQEDVPTAEDNEAALVTPRIVDNVVVLEGEAAASARVEAETVTIPASLAPSEVVALVPGDFLVSGEGDGFLRRVLGVDDDGAKSGGVRIRTEEARLTDVVRDGKIDTELALDPIAIDVSGALALGDEDQRVTLTPARLWIQPHVRLRIEIRSGAVKRFHTDIRVDRLTSLGLSASATSPKRFDKELSLWRSPKWRFTQMLGPIPLVEVLSFRLSAVLSGVLEAQSKLLLEGSCDHTQTYSLDYKNGRFSHKEDATSDCSGPAPSFASELSSFTFDAALKGTLSLDFYGLAGPFVALRDGLRADLAICPSPATLLLTSPLGLELGADLSKLGGKTYTTTLAEHAFDISKHSYDTSLFCRF